MARALLLPGRPMVMRYVGASVSTSNSTDAFMMPVVVWAKTLSSPWCVVATVRQPVSSRRSMIAWASAEPSSGSVPAPSSSRSTRLFGPADARMPMMFVMWLLNVDSDCSMLCSSPMSACTRVEDGQAAAGVGGNGEPGLRHRGQQPDGLQRNRLAAGVRAGDEQHGVCPADRQRYRDGVVGSSGWRAFTRCSTSGARTSHACDSPS